MDHSPSTTPTNSGAGKDARARAARLALIGLVTNAALSSVKLVAGIVGHSYALVADAVESLTDIVGSAVIWGGLRLASRPASEDHPYGFGKAEAVASMVVAFIIMAAGIGIAAEAIHQILTPHALPARFTLFVLVVVMVVKEVLFRLASRAAKETQSQAVKTDAWHHRADSLTSFAAFIGITIALIKGKGWEQADDWAALFAAGIILYNAVLLMRGPVRELLDAQETDVVEKARALAAGVANVKRVEKVLARRSGTEVWIDMHVWVDGAMTVTDAHTLAHAVKDSVRAGIPKVRDVLIHIEPARESPERP